ncbi:MAG: C40 family peptidase [Peptococcaceae bacterium]|nr:C40 family peptidase [Peptococcaceae bacterium]
MLVLTLLAGVTNPQSGYREHAATVQAENLISSNSAQNMDDNKPDQTIETPAQPQQEKPQAIQTAQAKSTQAKAVTASAKRVSPTPAPSRSQTSGTTAPAVSTSSITTSSKALAIVSTAKQYLGVRYVWGGTTPSGFDCSGFTKYVFAKNGITLPRISRDQYNVGKSVAFNNLQPADLVFFSMDGDRITDHVGIYIGNGQFIQASSSNGVMISSMSSYWKSRYLGAKRVL